MHNYVKQTAFKYRISLFFTSLFCSFYSIQLKNDKNTFSDILIQQTPGQAVTLPGMTGLTTNQVDRQDRQGHQDRQDRRDHQDRQDRQDRHQHPPIQQQQQRRRRQLKSPLKSLPGIKDSQGN